MPARAFLAVDLPSDVLRALEGAQEALRSTDSRWQDEKWVRTDLLHITVRFIGRVPDGSVTDLLATLRTGLAGTRPLALDLRGVRAVPNARRASMVWAVFGADVARLVALRTAIDEAIARSIGGPEEARALRPHVTLVRARKPHRLDPDALEVARLRLLASGKDTDGIVSVSSLTLYASTLGPSGPTYERLGEVALGTAGGGGAD